MTDPFIEAQRVLMAATRAHDAAQVAVVRTRRALDNAQAAVDRLQDLAELHDAVEADDTQRINAARTRLRRAKE